MNEFKRVSELDDWFETYGVELMPDPTKHRPRLLSRRPAFWWMIAFGCIAVMAGVAGFLAP